VSNSRGFLSQHGREHLLHHGLALDVCGHSGGVEKGRRTGCGVLGLIFDTVAGIQNQIPDASIAFSVFSVSKERPSSIPIIFRLVASASFEAGNAPNVR
jgi:hypothetical protein